MLKFKEYLKKKKLNEDAQDEETPGKIGQFLRWLANKTHPDNYHIIKKNKKWIIEDKNSNKQLGANFETKEEAQKYLSNIYKDYKSFNPLDDISQAVEGFLKGRYS